MPLPAPRRRDPRRLVWVALAVGAASLVAAVVVIALALTPGERPEETVAATFLAALLAGDGETAHGLTTPGYRAVVFARELDAIADELVDLAGPGAAVEILGSERTVPTPDPPTSLVGYQGDTRSGRLEGVVTLVELAPGSWAVREVSHRFPDAPPERVAPLQQLLRQLNRQVGERVTSAS